MKKVYYLSTCTTCKRIIQECDLKNLNFEFQDIKKDMVSEQQLDEMFKMTQSYEALFSKVARKYKELNLKEKKLSENDFKKYILEDYTFLKRPVIIIDDYISVGNSKKTIESLKQKLQNG